MAVITFEDVNPTLIENTTIVKGLVDGVHRNYRITPNDGYVLHDKNYDDNSVTPIMLGYRTSTASVAANYDFDANPREFYAVLADSVPADQIFGSVNINHDTM